MGRGFSNLHQFAVPLRLAGDYSDSPENGVGLAMEDRKTFPEDTHRDSLSQ